MFAAIRCAIAGRSPLAIAMILVSTILFNFICGLVAKLGQDEKVAFRPTRCYEACTSN